MASIFDMIDVKGTPRYRRDKRFVGADAVPAEVKEALNYDNMVDENGLVIVDNKGEAEGKLSDEEQKELDAQENKTPEGDENADQPTPNDSPESPAAPEAAAPPAPPTPETDPLDGPDEEGKVKPTKKEVSSRKPSARQPKFVSKVPQSHPGMGFPRKNGKTVDIFDGETPHTHIKLVAGYTVPLSTESFNDRTEKEIEEQLIKLGYEPIHIGEPDVSLNGLVDDAPDNDEEDDGLTDDSV